VRTPTAIRRFHVHSPLLTRLPTEDFDKAAAAGLLAQNPALVQMMQAKLGSLVGRSSGYIESLPASVRKRVAGLKGVQKEHAKLETQFQEEVLELEKKYHIKFIPLYEKRTKIVTGQIEPTKEEIEAGEQSDEEDEEEGDAMDAEKPEEAADDNTKGIPEFWLSAMKNQVSLAEMITDRDEEALKSLIDIRMEYLEKPGFKLIFDFASNDFFSNKTLSKTYLYQDENGYGGDFIYDHAEGDKIEWKPGKDLTVRIESKKQRNKSMLMVSNHAAINANTDIDTKQTRVVRKTVPCESFFNFFSPPKPPQEDGSDSSDIEERLELDYQLGEDIKEKLIPRAVDWFTGEALQFEHLDDFDEPDFEDEDDEDEDESEDRDDDDEESDEEVYSPSH
jgi:nucleosome assembly protein 1-like 1